MARKSLKEKKKPSHLTFDTYLKLSNAERGCEATSCRSFGSLEWCEPEVAGKKSLLIERCGAWEVARPAESRGMRNERGMIFTARDGRAKLGEMVVSYWSMPPVSLAVRKLAPAARALVPGVPG